MNVSSTPDDVGTELDKEEGDSHKQHIMEDDDKLQLQKYEQCWLYEYYWWFPIIVIIPRPGL